MDKFPVIVRERKYRTRRIKLRKLKEEKRREELEKEKEKIEAQHLAYEKKIKCKWSLLPEFLEIKKGIDSQKNFENRIRNSGVDRKKLRGEKENLRKKKKEISREIASGIFGEKLKSPESIENLKRIKSSLESRISRIDFFLSV